MPEPKRPLKVFLCHAHADRDPVRGLYTRLTKDGVDAWLDKEKLLPGQDWELEIRKAVRGIIYIYFKSHPSENHMPKLNIPSFFFSIFSADNLIVWNLYLDSKRC
ncbi:MAG: toll/interleukin-1 receptor domain-containing protein [Anaerolineales bacterium]|nr:toll/interleukin-1 receptor domain-containing protein [Anaerolineales bacterium]